MFSITRKQQDVSSPEDLVFTPGSSPDAAELIEHYVSTITKLKQDIRKLKEELEYHKKLHGEISDSLEEFLTIQKATEIITQHMEYEYIATSLLNLCRRVIDIKAGKVVLLMDDTWKFIPEDHSEEFTRLVERMNEEGFLEWIWERQETFVIPVEEVIGLDVPFFATGSFVLSPLYNNGNRLGILILYTEKEQMHFSLRDLELINLLGMQGAIAIQYTTIFKKLERMHIELKNSQASLMQAVKMATVGELAGGVAHEINNPLQIILGKIQIAMMGNVTPDTLKVIEMQALRIATIVRGLLMLAKENTSHNSDLVEINPLITSTIKLIKGQIEKRNIVIKTRLAERLPIISTSAVYLQQILLNFFLTAKKLMAKGGELVVETRQVDDNKILIRIQDTGHPYSPEEIAQILNPFQNPEKSSGNQMNLNLVVSVQMIRDINGDVRISSSEKGNTIEIEIPVQLNIGNSHEGQVANSA